MRTLARWCFQHRVLVLAGWLIVLLTFTGLAKSAGSTYSNSFALPGTESSRALDLLHKAAPTAGGDIDQIVIATDSGKVTDAAVRDRVAPALAKVAALPHVVSVTSPYSAAGARQVSADGTIAFATVTMDEQGQDLPKAAVTALVNTAQAAAGPGVHVQLGGFAVEQTETGSLGGVGFGILAAAVVLFLVFGSLVGMFLPLVTALLSLGAALGVIGLLSHGLTTASYTPELAALIGLGVGIDYALFIVSRYRQGLRSGLSPEEATVTAIDTSGRAVLFAGITVCIAVLGMFTLGLSAFYSLSLATGIAVIFTVTAALTLLPALLGIFGRRVLSRRVRRRVEAGTEVATDGLSPRWTAWAGMLKRRPALFAAAGIAAVAVVAIPFGSMRLGTSDAGNDPASTTTRQAYDLLARGFGAGFNGPLQVVTPVTSAAQLPNVAALDRAIAAQPGVAYVPPAVLLGHGDTQVALTTVYPTTSPQDAATVDLVKHLRSTTIPQAVKGTGLSAAVGGVTAIGVDFSDVVGGKLPLFMGSIILLSFLLLVMVFRSLLVPAVAAVMNLLSAGAAFGVMTAVFQWGWLGSALGIERGPIETFGPVLIFAILFGLSMDYEVFLISRIHEEWQHSKDNDRAVTSGLAVSGQIITAAAAIMVVVFGSFILGGVRVIKLFGLGLAGAVLVDALIVRSVIVPALMFGFGRANWYLPAALDRALPRVSVEPQESAPGARSGEPEMVSSH